MNWRGLMTNHCKSSSNELKARLKYLGDCPRCAVTYDGSCPIQRIVARLPTVLR
jgi:hypothetical protein